MKKQTLSKRGRSVAAKAGSFAAAADVHHPRLRSISDDELDEIFTLVGGELRNGRSSKAEEILTDALESRTLSPDAFANLKRLLSFTLETLGRYKESLSVVKPFEDEENLRQLGVETQVRVTTQLAIAYSNLSDQPKAVTLLKENLAKAQENELTHLSGNIDNALARVYRKLNECPIARDYAEKSLNYFRSNGDWIGMAEAYREIALSHHQEGGSERSLEYFDLGIKIIGSHSAPFMLGKLYTDMSGAYWFLRRPHDGIACLEKSIEFFDQTEHVLNSIIAYNNLGINLMLIGEWQKADDVINRALDLARKQNHVHIAGIMDSLGELKILREQFADAERLLTDAVRIANERRREWYAAQSMRNLARCYLAQGRFAEAAEKARETIELSGRIGERHYANMAGLVLAESLLKLARLDESENYLRVIEDSDPTSDFFVLGNIQRIRGLIALENDDAELAIHHFNRSLTIFESAEDIYHTALVHYLIGTHLDESQVSRAVKHLTAAEEVFRKLGIRSFTDAIANKVKKLKASPGGSKEHRRSSVVAQLLMVRLAEATASRELLFRELVAVLTQESQASRIIVAEYNSAQQVVPFITHGVPPNDSAALCLKFTDALQNNDERGFSKKTSTTVFPLRPSNANRAFLLIQPNAGAVLSDGTPLQPLLSVVELGMDVIALREKDKSQPIEQEVNPSASSTFMPGFIYSSPAMTSLVEEVYKIRSSDVTVLVTGESGTGKELVSRAIHTLSNRKDKIFIPFNCTAVPKELAEGHLFGYRKGAFTGAVTDSPGMIRAADGGTLFLDEIGDLPLDVQPKLLRFLQEGEIQPIGEKKPIKVDVRVIAATNMPLEEKVAEGTFREDLFYRLNVIRLRVPPLRERRSEIPPIINYYVNHYASRFGKHDITFTPQTVDLLMVCEWEGNVRQLCNEIQRIVARAVDNEVITPDHLSPDLKRSAKPLTTFGTPTDTVKPIASYATSYTAFGNVQAGSTLESAVGELETQMIKGALARHNWNISRVAGELGLTRRGLYLKLSRYGIEKTV